MVAEPLLLMGRLRSFADGARKLFAQETAAGDGEERARRSLNDCRSVVDALVMTATDKGGLRRARRERWWWWWKVEGGKPRTSELGPL